MTLDQLRYFAEAARFEHVGKAAKAASISPSAISGAIAALESELGCSLFERRGKNIFLSPEGRRLQDEAKRVFDQVAGLQRAVAHADTALEGSFRFGASHILTRHLLAPAWNALQARHPGLRADLCSMKTNRVVLEIVSGELDAGLCISPHSQPEMKEIEIHRGVLRVAVRKGHPLLRRKLAPAKLLAALSEFPATIHKAASGVDICESHPMFEKFDIVPDIHLAFDSDDFAVASVVESDSWSLLPDFVVERDPRVVLVPEPPGWHAPYNIAVVMRRRREGNPVLEALLGEVQRLDPRVTRAR